MKLLQVLIARFSTKLRSGYDIHIQAWANNLKSTISNPEISDLVLKYQDVPLRRAIQKPKPKKK